MKKILALVLTLALAMAMLAGCGSSAPAASTTAAEPVTGNATSGEVVWWSCIPTSK